MKMKNWRKIAWATQGRGTLKGVDIEGLFHYNFSLGSARQYRNIILESWNDKKKMNRFERQNSRRDRRDYT